MRICECPRLDVASAAAPSTEKSYAPTLLAFDDQGAPGSVGFGVRVLAVVAFFVLPQPHDNGERNAVGCAPLNFLASCTITP